MKKIILITGLLLALIPAISAQQSGTQKADKVVFLDGTIKEGKVTAQAEQKIKFVHRGETLDYEFNKREIEKIEYASGRTEVLNSKPAAVIITVSAVQNKVAVLPLAYASDESEEQNEAMRYQLQQYVVDQLSHSAAGLTFKDPAEVNALLVKNGITPGTIRGYTPKELASILQVEYVILGQVVRDNTHLVTVSHSNSTRRDRDDRYKYDRNYSRKEHRTSSTVTKQQFRTDVTLSVYNDAGEKIYSQSRQSFWSTPGAYKITLSYLLKRTPLYKR